MSKFKRRSAVAAALCLLAAGAAGAQNAKYRTLEGKVFGSDETPLPNAIVYLEDSKTNDIRSFISTQDGSYRFGQVSPDVDYQVWAKYKNAKSPSKTISSFDSRKVVVIDFHLKTGN